MVKVVIKTPKIVITIQYIVRQSSKISNIIQVYYKVIL